MCLIQNHPRSKDNIASYACNSLGGGTVPGRWQQQPNDTLATALSASLSQGGLWLFSGESLGRTRCAVSLSSLQKHRKPTQCSNAGIRWDYHWVLRHCRHDKLIQIDRNCMELCITTCFLVSCTALMHRHNAKVKISGSARPRVLVFRTALSQKSCSTMQYLASPEIPSVQTASVTGKAILFAVGEDRVLCLRLHWFQEREGSEFKFWDDMAENWFYFFVGWIVLFMWKMWSPCLSTNWH